MKKPLYVAVIKVFSAFFIPFLILFLNYQAKLLIKENGIIAGIEIAEKIVKIIDPTIEFTHILKDGDKVNIGDIAFTLHGKSIKLLLAERLLLNIMQPFSNLMMC